MIDVNGNGQEVDLDGGTIAVDLNGVRRGLLVERGLRGPVRVYVEMKILR